MGVGSGLGGSFGIAPETTFGTYVAPTRFFDAQTVQLKKVKNVVQGGGLAAGRLVQPASRRVVTSQAAAGDVELEVLNRGMGLLLAQIFGGTPTPVQQGATAAYLQTHPLADNLGRFFTAQVGVPDTTGTVRPYTYLGTKVLDAEFSCGVNENLMVKLSLDSKDVSESQSLAAPSFTAGVQQFHFAQMGVKLGATYGSETAVDGVRKVSVKVSRGQNVDRYYANGAGKKAEPIMNDRVQITGTIETDFLDKASFADRFAADTQFSLVWEFVAATPIAPTYYPTFRLKLPACFLDGDTPTLDGPEVVQPSFGFTALYDLTNPPVTCEYLSADVAL